jgi:hypothetical protein
MRPDAAAAVVLALGLLTACAVPARAALAPEVREVKVERVRPKREKFATLRFLKENADFIRSRFDRLRETPTGSDGEAQEIDPRFLAYRQMLADVFASRESIAVADNARERQELFASITDLGALESQLDQMDRLLAAQRSRLGVLQADFTGRQQTALMVVLSGYPSDADVSTVGITLEGGDTLSIPLSPEQRTGLRQGGILQIFHGLIEPREQVLEVSLGGARWPTGDSGFVTLDPSRDRLTFLRLDLATLKSTLGATSLTATTWLHDGTPDPGSISESHP